MHRLFVVYHDPVGGGRYEVEVNYTLEHMHMYMYEVVRKACREAPWVFLVMGCESDLDAHDLLIGQLCASPEWVNDHHWFLSRFEEDLLPDSDDTLRTHPIPNGVVHTVRGSTLAAIASLIEQSPTIFLLPHKGERFSLDSDDENEEEVVNR